MKIRVQAPVFPDLVRDFEALEITVEYDDGHSMIISCLTAEGLGERVVIPQGKWDYFAVLEYATTAEMIQAEKVRLDIQKKYQSEMEAAGLGRRAR